jgi:hypothetical protein
MENKKFWSRGLSNEVTEAEMLLSRYPHISERELGALIRAFSRLPPLDFGMVAADDRLGAKLDALFADHGERIRSPFQTLSIVLSALAFAALIALMYAAMA